MRGVLETVTLLIISFSLMVVIPMLIGRDDDH